MNNFIKLYALTFSGKRVCFVYGRTSKRLPAVCPLTLFGQVIYDPITLETQFICFDNRYSPELYQIFKVIANERFDDTAYRKICNLSHRNFLDYVHSFHVVKVSDGVVSYQQDIEENVLFG